MGGVKVKGTMAKGTETRSGRARGAILRALHRASGPVGAARLAEMLAGMGVDLRPRAVRYHLLHLDRAGLTRTVDRRHGRVLTDRGVDEVLRAGAVEKVGFIASQVDDLGYRMTFDLRTGAGSMVVNVARIDERDLPRSIQQIEPVVRARLGMGSRLILGRAGERVGDYVVPYDCVAFGTACSVAVNGILLKYGIPVVSRYGGLLEMAGGRPVRFVELLEYRGTTVDPLAIFIRAGMTRVLAAARTGDGLVGASFREIPAVAVPDVRRIQREMQRHDLGAILEIGRPSRPLLDIPVQEGRAGMIVLGGLNSFAALQESGIPVHIEPLAGLADIAGFRSFRDIAVFGRRQSPMID